MDDVGPMLDIYEPVVRDTIISFEYAPPTVEAFAQRVMETLPSKPWLVYVDGSDVLGYAYGSTFRTRTAYQWSVEVSAYVAEGARGRGVGRALYDSLLAILRLQGFVKAFAGITLPNPESVTFHEALGFTLVGVLRDVGYKLGGWHDVGWWQRGLADAPPAGPPAANGDGRGSATRRMEWSRECRNEMSGGSYRRGT
jgi:phosphinothricin acetyltransferase